MITTKAPLSTTTIPTQSTVATSTVPVREASTSLYGGEQLLAQSTINYCTHEQEAAGLNCVGVDDPQAAASRVNEGLNNATDAAEGVLLMIPGRQGTEAEGEGFRPIEGARQVLDATGRALDYSEGN